MGCDPEQKGCDTGVRPCRGFKLRAPPTWEAVCVGTACLDLGPRGPSLNPDFITSCVTLSKSSNLSVPQLCSL